MTINLALNGGIIGQASNAADEYDQASEDEKTMLWQAEYEMWKNGVGELPPKPQYETMYDDKGLTTAPIPSGFTASATVGETDIGTGKVIKSVSGADTSEFVWIPVPHACIDVGTLSDAEITVALAYEASEGYYPMAVKSANGDYRGALYDFQLNAGAVKVIPRRIGDTSYKEPEVLPDSGYDDTATNYTSAGLPSMTAAEFKTRLQVEFNETIENVIANGGFYIGRYETSIRTGDIVQSKSGILPMSGRTWYSMYAVQGSYATDNSIATVSSGMVWGSEWDQMMIWMKDVQNPNAGNKPYILDATGMANYSGSKTSTGVNDYKVNNIFDVAGNVRAWTLEMSGPYTRTRRGRSDMLTALVPSITQPED